MLRGGIARTSSPSSLCSAFVGTEYVGAGAAVATRLGAARSYPSSLGALAAVRARLVGPARRWPGAEELVRDLVTLPTHSLLSERDLEALTKSVTG